jgi:hypothetical protein
MYNLLLHRQPKIIASDAMVVGFFNTVELGERADHYQAAFQDNLHLSWLSMGATTT